MKRIKRRILKKHKTKRLTPILININFNLYGMSKYDQDRQMKNFLNNKEITNSFKGTLYKPIIFYTNDNTKGSEGSISIEILNYGIKSHLDNIKDSNGFVSSIALERIKKIYDALS